MKRLVPLVLLGVIDVARADSTQPIGSGSLTLTDKLWLHEHNNPELAQPLQVPSSLWAYFNLASCRCSRPGNSHITPWFQGQYALEVDALPDVSQVHRPLEIWVGANCNDTIMRPMNCHQVVSAGVPDIATIQITKFVRPEVPVYDLMVPEPGGGPCVPRVLTAAEWGIADSMGTGVFDFFISQAVNTDSLPPPLPTSFTVEGAENAIQLSWGAPSGDVADIAYFQALCADSHGHPATANPPAPRYMTARLLCGDPEDIVLVPSSVSSSTAVDAGIPALDASTAALDASAATFDAGTGTVDAGTVMLVPGLAQLDPAFLCADVANATATSMRIGGLTNGEPYTVVLLAIDVYGNAAGTFFTSPLTPQRVTDFWEDLHGQGSTVQGGFCLIADTFGDDHPLTEALRSFRDDTLARTALGRWLIDVYYATLARLGARVHGHVVLRVVAAVLLLPLVAVALAWHFLGLPGALALVTLVGLLRRRRRCRFHLPRRALACAAVSAAILLAPGRARAQCPFWQDPMGNDTAQPGFAAGDPPPIVHWRAGIRIGPYIPQIDAQLGASPGPYEQMFGSRAAWVPMFDLDRVLWSRYGQVTIGGTIGYLGRSAHAWVDGSVPSDPNRPRSPGDTNSFHLIPFAVLASYRYTILDDEYRIPVVPYARAGLAYYAWWVTSPSGGFATVAGMNEAAGASFGVQGSIGLSVRAERLDESAAVSMRESGIQHASFYAELQAAKVDGFGSSSKLAVGDSTWFAGVDFEF